MAFAFLLQRRFVSLASPMRAPTSKLVQRIAARSRRRFFCAEAAKGAEECQVPPARVLVRHFVTCAVPMVGFGIMDNSILIRAGDAIDNSLGETFDLTGLQCAACGQILSDFSGVVFGGVIESLSRKFILPPTFTNAQNAMRVTQIVGTAGAAIGVVVGCIIGMGNFLIMDLKEQERQKQLDDMQKLFDKVLPSSLKAFGAEFGSIFLVDEEAQELWTFSQKGSDFVIRIPLKDTSIVGYSAVHKQSLNVKDAYKDPRFNPETDKKTGRHTKTVASFPIFAQGDSSKVLGVIQLINKNGGFTKEDMTTGTMVAEFTSIFLSELLDPK